MNHRRLCVALAAVLLVGLNTPVQAQVAVYDPTNHVQNVLQAARALEQINNQIQSLQNEATALVNQARNLASLPYSSLATLQGQIDRTRGLLAEAQTLIGVLAQVYIDETGTPKKPVAPAGLIEAIFRYQDSAELKPAYEAVISRCQPQSRKYLRLPGDVLERIPLALALANGQLRGASGGDASLLEEAAPSSRAIQPNGGPISLSTDAFIDRLATEFVVPKSILAPDQASSVTFEVPELTGFIVWGPNTGMFLR